MAYEPINWIDLPSEETPMDADNLNHMDAQIKANADFIDNIGGTVPTQQELLDLKMLGWTVPKEMTVQNYIDDDRVFHQKVGRIDLSTLSWAITGSNLRFVSNIIGNIKKPSVATEIANIYCSKEPRKNANVIGGGQEGIAIMTDGAVWIRDTKYQTVPTFTNAFKNVYLYYELENEIILTDGNEATTNQMLSDGWSSATTYAQGDFAIYKNKLWKSKVASNLNHEPIEGSYWTETSVSNEFVNKIQIKKTSGTTSATGAISSGIGGIVAGNNHILEARMVNKIGLAQHRGDGYIMVYDMSHSPLANTAVELEIYYTN